MFGNIAACEAWSRRRRAGLHRSDDEALGDRSGRRGHRRAIRGAWECRDGGWPSCCAISCRMDRSEEHTSELQSLMRNTYAVFCLIKKSQYKRLSNMYVV